MKKFILVLVSAIALFGFVSCDNTKSLQKQLTEAGFESYDRFELVYEAAFPGNHEIIFNFYYADKETDVVYMTHVMLVQPAITHRGYLSHAITPIFNADGTLVTKEQFLKGLSSKGENK